MIEVPKINLVLFLLKDQLEIIPLESLSKTVTVGKDVYSQKSEGDFNGFYDWLRDYEGKITGLRYYLFEDIRFLIEPLRTLNYVGLELTDWNNAVASFCFYQDGEVDESVSHDQLFGDNYIYMSADNVYGLTFVLPDDSFELGDLI